MFPSEIYEFWNRRWSGLTVLYLCSRYINMLYWLVTTAISFIAGSRTVFAKAILLHFVFSHILYPVVSHHTIFEAQANNTRGQSCSGLYFLSVVTTYTGVVSLKGVNETYSITLIHSLISISYSCVYPAYLGNLSKKQNSSLLSMFIGAHLVNGGPCEMLFPSCYVSLTLLHSTELILGRISRVSYGTYFIWYRRVHLGQ